jgi:hypothetical protein
MDVPVELHHEPERRAVEVHDEAMQDVLAAEPETEQATIAEKRPRVALGRRRLPTKLSREGDSLRHRDSTYRIHDRQ